MPGLKFHRGRWWTTKGPSKTPSSVPEISAFCLNVNGMNRTSKKNILSAMRKEHDWGILMMCNTRIYDEREILTTNRVFGCKEAVWSLETPNAGGTAILFLKPVLLTAKFSDPAGQYCRADFEWEGESFTLMCIYAPADPGRRKKFQCEHLKKHLESHPVKDKCFLAGDFNFVENPLLDRASANTQGGVVGSEQ
jgi:exonuclease III